MVFSSQLSCIIMLLDVCETEDRIVCKHSRFCAETVSGTECNSSVYLCIERNRGCNGELDCLQGDVSDELGCKLVKH